MRSSLLAPGSTNSTLGGAACSPAPAAGCTRGQSWSWSLTDPPFLSQQLLGASVSTESSFTVHVQGAQPHTCNAALQFFVLQDKSFCIFPLLTYLHLPLAFHGIWVR